MVAVQADVPGRVSKRRRRCPTSRRRTSARSRCRPTRRSWSWRRSELAAAYADVINKGESSEFYDMFEAEGDHFRDEHRRRPRSERLDAFNTTAAHDGQPHVRVVAGRSRPFALPRSRAARSSPCNVNETDTVTPTNADAVIKLENNPTREDARRRRAVLDGLLDDLHRSALLLRARAQGSNEKIRLLGYSSDILDAKVIK